MSEGFVAGGSGVSGTQNASYFNHQPPPVAGLAGTQIPEPEPESPSPEIFSSSRPDLNQRQSTRAHFPDGIDDLERRISAPRYHTVDTSDSRTTTADSEKQSESTRDPRGFWQHVRQYFRDLKEDYGPADAHQEITNLIGDAGIDIQALKKVKKSAPHLTSLVGSSLMLSTQAFAKQYSHSPSHSVSSTPSLHDTGISTPGTPSKHGHHSGIDPRDVTKALRDLKRKIANEKDGKEAKYIQSKSELAHRRNLVLLLTYAFMLYGAPSHRIEEYVLALFKACGMDGRVNYTVGCTEICFINPPDPEDPMTRSAYTTLVKAQGLDIGALEVSFRIYKDIIHGDISIEEGSSQVVHLLESPPYHGSWFIVPFYGLASAFACVWAYDGYWTDMAIAFFLGCIVGFLQIIVSSRNPLYANVLETTAAVITSFGARAFSSIGGSGQKYFCFAAIAESSITTILPGYIVLCGALELQSKSVTAGSTRLFYAVMYSLFLGYGIDVGSQLWAVIDPNAPTSTTCPRKVDPHWKILLVPCYLILQATLLRSRPRQMPIQVLFGSAAYTVNYFVSKYATAQVADTASAFVLGTLGHLYARTEHGFAFASVVAGIMVLVPSGLSAEGGLVSGITSPLFNNGTTDAQDVYEKNIYQSFSVGAQMIQVAVGLSVGLFVSALAIYPLGRKNNALFSF